MSMKLGPKNITNFGTTTSKQAKFLPKDLPKQLRMRVPLPHRHLPEA
jgi:hypothetical protein